MATGNIASGHTRGNTADTVDALRDGDHILSPSFTNPYEGIHGNGVLPSIKVAGTYHSTDGDYDQTSRNDPEAIAGAVNRVAGTPSATVLIDGGFAVIDGVLYKFGDSGGGSLQFQIGNGSPHDKTPSGSATLTTGQEVLYVIYACSDKGTNVFNVCYEQGTPVTAATDVYPDNPNAYLQDPDSTLPNKQHTILASVRAEYNASGGNDKIDILEVNDKRCFIRTAPWYIPTIRGFNAGGTGTAVKSALELASVFDGSDQKGDIDGTGTPYGAVWQSVDPNGNDGLYYTALDSGVRHTWRMGPDKVKVITTAANQTFTFDGYNIWIITATAPLNLDPVVAADFPPGHIIEVRAITSTVTFDSLGLNEAVAAGRYGRFVYDGTNWNKLLLQTVL